jgi:hypothetical protein
MTGHGSVERAGLEQLGEEGGRAQQPVLARSLGDGDGARRRVAAVPVEDEDAAAAGRRRRRQQVAQDERVRVDVQRQRAPERQVVVRAP